MSHGSSEVLDLLDLVDSQATPRPRVFFMSATPMVDSASEVADMLGLLGPLPAGEALGGIADEEPGEIADEEPGEIADEEPGEVADEEPGEVADEEPGEVAGEGPGEVADEEPGEVADEALGDALARVPDNRERLLGAHGFVRLIDAMPRLTEGGGLGPEAAIVQAARVSTGAGTKTVQADEALLRYLYRHDHHTPFEMVVLKFGVRAPIFTARQWMRHRAGSFNEQSARYGKVPADFYVPEPEELRAQSRANRQGTDEPLPSEDAEKIRREMIWGDEYATEVYEGNLDKGLTRELARIVLPVALYTTFYWTVNLRNLFHFLELRLAPEAQANIRAYAAAILDILRGYCPLAVRAFEDYTLNAVRLTAIETRALRALVTDLRDAAAHYQAPTEAEAGMSARERAEWARKRSLLGLP